MDWFFVALTVDVAGIVGLAFCSSVREAGRP
ncbi:MAG: hypothetical protein QOH36_613 [Actinomycetota bacterium]|jgi:hypothetical protein|nr:hypothetical protein [Actinomycetota bacterium]